MYVSLAGQDQYSDSLKNPKAAYYGGVHFAGNTGLLSISFGKKFFNDRLVLGAGYGYLPESINGVEVHSILLKTSYNFSKGILYKKAKWYAGFSTIYGIASNTFIKLPGYYPKEYYAPTAIHFAPFIGVRVPFFIYKPIWASKVCFHAELGTVDSYLWYSIINKEIKLWDIVNFSMGIYYDL